MLRALRLRWLIGIALVCFFAALGAYFARSGSAGSQSHIPGGKAAPPSQDWRDRFGDGFPEAARLDRPADREHFARWATFLAESVYYRPTPPALEEVTDCAALIRFAYRNALAAHSPAWRNSLGLASDPGFAEISKFNYPAWPLGRGLFRTRPGPFDSTDVESGVFAEFADAKTLLRLNTFAISRDMRAARPGDLIFFHQREQAQPYHAMLFVGRSHFQPQGDDWIVYHTGAIAGRPGEVRHVRGGTLIEHPDPRWRPLEVNPRFLGVYRFALLR